MRHFLTILLTICLCSLHASSQQTLQVKSPDGQLVFSVKQVKGTATYSVRYHQMELIKPSTLSLQFDNGLFRDHLSFSTSKYLDTTERYELVIGKTSSVVAHYRSLVISIKETTAPYRVINLQVKIFDDGLAFRYEIPEQKEWKNFSLLEENTAFYIAGNPVVRALLLPNYTSSHEGLYTTIPFQLLKEDTLMDMPALLEYPQHIYLAITEAALLDYAGMYLMKKDGILISKLSPLPGQTAVKVNAALPHRSPWRVMMISDRIGALIESNILTTLNEPSKIGDVSWLKPGKTTFPWWNGNVVPDTLNAPGNNFVTAQYYIDFCARNGIPYHSVVEYGLHQWYVDDGAGFQPGPHNDVTKAVPGLDMKEVCDYAATKGVGIRVWVHWAALYPRLDKAFAQFEKWGLKGMMVDFMDRDDQEMVNIQTEILQKAAQHHLHIQFHGAYKPTGLSRTYPNEFTREGTLNYETNKWNNSGLSPDHDINIPFTRMLAGSTDYHLGGFRAVPQAGFQAQYTKPLMLGTRCHQLAMYVVLENYLGMVCDYPAAYEGQDGFEFIKEVPTTWDETKVLDAKPGAYIIIARRKAGDWYIGAITNSDKRQVTFSLSFLDKGRYNVILFADAKDDDTNPNHLMKQSQTVTNNDSMMLDLFSGGGAALHLVKMN